VCRILDVFDTALMIDDRRVHGREESHRFHVVITTDVLQRAVRHGGQIYVIPIGHERFDRFAQNFHAGRVDILEGCHVKDYALRSTGHRPVFVPRRLDQFPLKVIPVYHVNTSGVPDDLDVGYFDGDGVQVQPHV